MIPYQKLSGGSKVDVRMKFEKNFLTNFSDGSRGFMNMSFVMIYP